MGHGSCAAFSLAVNECNHGHCRDLNAFSDWLMGYITAYNSSTPDTFDVVANTDLKSALQWLGHYCKQKAVEKLMVELSPTRQKLRPKDWVEK